MKLSRKVKLLTLILMCTTVFFIYNETNKNNITYTIMGDNLSLGIDSFGRKIYGYGEYVKDYLKEKQKLKEYSNSLVESDMTIEKLYNYILTNKKVKYNNKKYNIKAKLHETDILTISIGLNDLLYKININNEISSNDLNTIIDDIEETFNKLIEEIRKVYKHDIYVIGYYDFNEDNAIYNQAIKKLNNIYKKNKEVIYISTSIISENSNIFLSNPSNYYPNYKGYRVISSKIIDKISKKLEN